MTAIHTVEVMDAGTSKVVCQYSVSSFICEQYKRGNLSTHQLKAAALFKATVELAFSPDREAGVIDPERIRVDHSVRNVFPEWIYQDRQRAMDWLDETRKSMSEDHFSCLVDVCFTDSSPSQWAGVTVAKEKSDRTKRRIGMDFLRQALNQVVVSKAY